MAQDIPDWAQDENYEFVDDLGMFEKLDVSYDDERELYDMVQLECFAMFGSPVLYYLTSYDKDYNKVAGEDANRRIERAFEIMAMPDQLPEERQQFGYTIENLDSFLLYVNKEHFKHASMRELPKAPDDPTGTKRTNFSLNYLTTDSGTGSVVWREQFMNSEFSFEFERGVPFQSYIPKVGDIIKMRFNNFLYEVKAVKEEDEMFHQHKHSWTLRVAKWVNNHINLSCPQLGQDDEIVVPEVPQMEFDNSDDVTVIANGEPNTPPAGFHDGTSGAGRFKRIYTPDPNEKKPNFSGDGF